MSLQLLPCELIFHILDFIPTERYYQAIIDDINDDSIEEAIKCGLISSQDQYENMVSFITEYGEGMYYAYPILAPQGRRADQMLLTAAASKSLERYIRTVSNINSTLANKSEAKARRKWRTAQF